MHKSSSILKLSKAENDDLKKIFHTLSKISLKTTHRIENLSQNILQPYNILVSQTI